MRRAIRIRLAAFVALAITGLAKVAGQPSVLYEAFDVQSGPHTLRAQLWRPAGGGRFPAVLFNHGSYTTADPWRETDTVTLGTVFARHGYVLLWLHRQGVGLSSSQGLSDGNEMVRALETDGVEARNRVQLHRLENESMNEATAALGRLRARNDVDVRRIAVVGHSFGGAISLVVLERDPEIRAAVIFGGAANSWNQSPVLRQRLLAAVAQASAPTFFVYAENDYSTAPGRELAAEMKRLGKAHALKIYPPFGADAWTGHNLIFASVPTWESDVFAFLDEHLRR